MTTTEFDRQLRTYLDTGWPDLSGLSVEDFAAMVEPLRDKAAQLEATVSDEGSSVGTGPVDPPIPFALVVTSQVVTADRALPSIHWRTTTGWTEYSADELAAYAPVDGVELPHPTAYLVTGVDTGKGTLDVRAKDAVPIIEAQGRSPLTVDEGVCLLALFPGILKDRNAFFLPGSRDTTKRVAALWVSKGHPRLGWCWEGNPHTWLGSASCVGRVA
ncbi:DUF5701 family protein [Pedococcus aerophilus]|uniref:DUF5701 family protein n=1 Tax=Pedococcus aerophilus TaxID=436356 RepID=A0ABN3USW5_9MICO